MGCRSPPHPAQRGRLEAARGARLPRSAALVGVEDALELAAGPPAHQTQQGAAERAEARRPFEDQGHPAAVGGGFHRPGAGERAQQLAQRGRIGRRVLEADRQTFLAWGTGRLSDGDALQAGLRIDGGRRELARFARLFDRPHRKAA